MFTEPFPCKGQDTVLLMNGDVLSGKFNADMGDFFSFSISRRQKVLSVAIEKTDVFSLLVQGKDERIFYQPDSATGNDFSVDQMRDFREGEHAARIHYKPVLPLIGGALIGAASPAIGFWGLTLAPLYLGGLSMSKPYPTDKVSLSPGIKDPEFFKMGYGYTARRIKVQRSALAALGGIVTVWVIKVATSGLK
ncbi:MAG: hypothetical protein AB9842_06125 [Bacteroidales bacterium]